MQKLDFQHNKTIFEKNRYEKYSNTNRTNAKR
jgi:hypothetical protein